MGVANGPRTAGQLLTLRLSDPELAGHELFSTCQQQAGLVCRSMSRKGADVEEVASATALRVIDRDWALLRRMASGASLSGVVAGVARRVVLEDNRASGRLRSALEEFGRRGEMGQKPAGDAICRKSVPLPGNLAALTRAQGAAVRALAATGSVAAGAHMLGVSRKSIIGRLQRARIRAEDPGRAARCRQNVVAIGTPSLEALRRLSPRLRRLYELTLTVHSRAALASRLGWTAKTLHAALSRLRKSLGTPTRASAIRDEGGEAVEHR
jgi:hypothetical protein